MAKLFSYSYCTRMMILSVSFITDHAENNTATVTLAGHRIAVRLTFALMVSNLLFSLHYKKMIK